MAPNSASRCAGQISARMASSTARIRQRDRMTFFPLHESTRPGDEVPGPRQSTRHYRLRRCSALLLGLGFARIELRISRVLARLLLVTRQRLAALDGDLVIR